MSMELLEPCHRDSMVEHCPDHLNQEENPSFCGREKPDGSTKEREPF